MDLKIQMKKRTDIGKIKLIEIRSKDEGKQFY